MNKATKAAIPDAVRRSGGPNLPPDWLSMPLKSGTCILRVVEMNNNLMMIKYLVDQRIGNNTGLMGTSDKSHTKIK